MYEQIQRRAADRERERQSADAIRRLSEDVAELVELRGRVAVARAILVADGGRQQAIDALDGHPVTPVPQLKEE